MDEAGLSASQKWFRGVWLDGKAQVTSPGPLPFGVYLHFPIVLQLSSIPNGTAGGQSSITIERVSSTNAQITDSSWREGKTPRREVHWFSVHRVEASPKHRRPGALPASSDNRK